MSRINNREPEVNETTRLLQHSIRIARENEDIAERTIEEVMEQGIKLDDARDKVDEIQDMSIAAQSSVNTLRSRIFNKKLQLGGVIVLLLVVNVSLIVRMWYHHGSLYS